MKTTSLSVASFAAALVATTLFAVSSVAQAPQGPPPGKAPQHEHEPEPAPTNLQVLPKNMTGEQVHELMHKWEAALGAKCSTCHAADPKKVGPNGRPALNFADDGKREKATARMMYRMTENINKDYISKVENSGDPVTCGTCHRGHIGPEPFVAPPEHHDGPPPAGQKPPVPK